MMPPTALSHQRRMVATLVRRMRRAGGAQVRLFETHISWVIVQADRAFKIKKAIRLAFLDWRPASERARCCHLEVSLNRRYAPDLYLGVVPITGSVTAPRIGGDGRAIEHAVRLRAFPQDALWSVRLAQGRLTAPEAASLGRALARFHAGTALAPTALDWGTPAHIAARTSADLGELRALLPGEAATLAALTAWHARVAPRLRRLFAWRRSRGAVRECHGDLHCDNIVTLDGVALPFDGIDFDPALRWIDTMQDMAFAWMDLQVHGRPDLAVLLLSAYLQEGGDDAGLAVLPYYTVQRALVRAKVAALRGDAASARRYLRCAADWTAPTRPALLVTTGLSGSGKSTVCAALAGPLRALVVRSDVERRHLAAQQDGRAGYTPEETARVYARVRRVARHALAAGLPVLVDAACLQRWQRETFRSLAATLAIPYLLLVVTAVTAELPERLRRRAAAGNDPSEADTTVLARQLATAQAPGANELAHALVVDAAVPCLSAVLRQLQPWQPPAPLEHVSTHA